MANFKKELENFKITDEHRAVLTEAEIAELEELVRELREGDIEEIEFKNPIRFDAKDMVPVGQDEPVDWNPKKK